MTEPTPTTDEFVPTRNDLQKIADFLFQRSLDEASQVGGQNYYREQGVTVSVRVPKAVGVNAASAREVTKQWHDDHPPDRFSDLASQLAAVAGGMAATSPFKAQAIAEQSEMRHRWRVLTSAARLWESHPDFLPWWAKAEDEV